MYINPSTLNTISKLIEMISSEDGVFLVAKISDEKMDELSTLGSSLEDLEDSGDYEEDPAEI